LRRVLRHRRPLLAAAVAVCALLALSFAAASGQTAGGIAAACGIAALGCLDALLLLPRREGGSSTALPRPDDAAGDAAGRHREATQLAAGVAHNFNNVLQGVIGSLELLIDQVEADTPARKFAGMSLDAAMRGSRLTHHLLSYAGNQMLRPETIAVADFLNSMEFALSRMLGPHIAIDLLVRGAPVVFADPGDLQTALRNIAVNAAQAMPSGGILRIEAQEQIAGGAAWVGIAITDTGTGMDAATLAQAVAPFFTTKGGACAGLGLSMAKGFAEQSGGTLQIASAPGRGTVVTLRLPAAAPRPLAVNDAGAAEVHRPLRQYG
jgi:signal transduction histidine kinase